MFDIPLEVLKKSFCIPHELSILSILEHASWARKWSVTLRESHFKSSVKTINLLANFPVFVCKFQISGLGKA